MICFDFFTQGLDWFQYRCSETFLTCTTTELCNIVSKKLDWCRRMRFWISFDANNIIKQKEAILEKSKCL